MFKTPKTISGAQLISESASHFKVCHFVEVASLYSIPDRLCCMTPISCIRILRQKRMFAYLVKPPRFVKPEGHYCGYKSQLLDPILSQLNSYFHAYFWRLILVYSPIYTQVFHVVCSFLSFQSKSRPCISFLTWITSFLVIWVPW